MEAAAVDGARAVAELISHGRCCGLEVALSASEMMDRRSAGGAVWPGRVSKRSTRAWGGRDQVEEGSLVLPQHDLVPLLVALSMV